MIKIRSGIGYDIHRLAKGSGLFVGGIKVSGKLKAVAHSDGDVLIHSLIDSLFGAIGERDIGQQFPGTDPQYRGIRSSVLLARTREIVEKNNYEILNIDAVVVAENVKIADYKEEIRNNLAQILGISRKDFNLKGKSKEKLGEVGRGKAIECYAVSMVRYKG